MCPLSEDTQPVRPVPVSLAQAGLAQTRPAGLSSEEQKQGISRTANPSPGDTQPVKTQPVHAVPVHHSSPFDPELGRLIFAYRTPPPSKAFKWAWGLGGSLLSLSAIGFGVYLAFTTYEKYGPVPALARSAPWLISGFAVLFTWVSIGLLRWARTQPGIRLHANGLFIEGRRNQSLTWDQIDGISQGVTAPDRLRPREMRYQVHLFPSKGRPVHLHGSGDGTRGMPYLPELASRVKASLYPNLQVELARMFREGVPLRFGPLRIDREGLQARRWGPVPGTFSVHWRHVKRITVQSGYFLVESIDRRSPYRLPVSKIPNLEILLKIIDQGVQQ